MSDVLEYPVAQAVNVKTDEFDVYVGRGRGSKWGNPFVIGPDGDRPGVIAKYRDWIQTQPELLEALPELVGKRLGCYCHPAACHGDVLAELANELAQTQQQEAQLSAAPTQERTRAMSASTNIGADRPGPLDGPSIPAGGKVLVCGSRDWPAERAGEIRERISQLPEGTTIVAGGARGADKMAEDFARELGYPVQIHQALWETEGRSAGYKRNLRMLDQAPDLVIAFRVGESRGTSHTLEHAEKRGIDVEVYDELTFVEVAEVAQAAVDAPSIRQGDAAASTEVELEPAPGADEYAAISREFDASEGPIAEAPAPDPVIAAAPAGVPVNAPSEPQLAFLEDLYEATGEQARIVTTSAEATAEIDRLKNIRELDVTDKQKEMLRDRCEREGVPYVEPKTRTEFRDRLKEVSQVTEGQQRMLRRLSMQLGRSFAPPEDRFAAKRQIDDLLSARDGARSSIEVTSEEIGRVRTDLEAELAERGEAFDVFGHPIESLDALSDKDIERIATQRRFQQDASRDARAEARELSSEAASSGAAGIGVPYMDDEIVRPSDLVTESAEEKFRQMSPVQRERYREAVAEGRIADFGGAPGSEAEWAYGGQGRTTIPGVPPSQDQIDLIERLVEEKVAKDGKQYAVDMPLDSREASRMIDSLKGPDPGPSSQQMEFLADLTERLNRSTPEVLTSRQAQEEITRLTRIEHAKNPQMKPAKGQLEYMDKLAGDVGLEVAHPSSAIRADRMIDQLKQLRQEDPAEQAVTRDLLTSPHSDFDDALGALRPNEQGVLRARYRDGLNVREAATQLRMSPRDVEVLETIGRDKFRRARAMARPKAAQQQSPNLSAVHAPPAGA